MLLDQLNLSINNAVQKNAYEMADLPHLLVGFRAIDVAWDHGNLLLYLWKPSWLEKGDIGIWIASWALKEKPLLKHMRWPPTQGVKLLPSAFLSSLVLEQSLLKDIFLR